MAKQNCWEFKKCGREPGGSKVAELGVCSAAIETRTNGMNDGLNGGRVCWAIAGTMCGGKVHGSFALKIVDCTKCEFYEKVCKEQGKEFKCGKDVREKLKK